MGGVILGILSTQQVSSFFLENQIMTTFLKPEHSPAALQGLPRGPGCLVTPGHFGPEPAMWSETGAEGTAWCSPALGPQPVNTPDPGARGVLTSREFGLLAGCAVYTLDSGIRSCLCKAGQGWAACSPAPSPTDRLLIHDKSTLVLNGICFVYFLISSVRSGQGAGAGGGPGSPVSRQIGRAHV